jgi:sugar-specific transcriptional regulator TrmB
MPNALTAILGAKQATVYQASLELGIATVQQIAHQAHLPRSTCYLLLEELKSQGLISTTKRGKKTLMVAESPDKLVQLVADQQQSLGNARTKLAATLPQLNALYNAVPQKPAVTYYEGLTGIKTILEETLAASEIFVLCSGYSKPLPKALNSYLDDYFERLDQKQILTKEIIGGSPDARAYQKHYEGKFHQIKVHHFGDQLAHIDKMIYGDKLAIVSYEFLNGVVIENRQIVEFERVLVKQLWRMTI